MMRLLLYNLRWRWREWRARRRQRRDGQVIDIRSAFKKKGLP
jgi:hypothetical protein